MLTIDLNADMGESFGPWPMGADEALMPLVTSVSVACGAHAGDPVVMRRTLELAAAHRVAVGAHPGYPDLQGFGRRALAMAPAEVEAWTLAQIGALAGVARAVGVPLRHVKPHGALYNQAAEDEALAEAIARAVRAFDPDLTLVVRAGSPQVEVSKAAGLRVAEEAFADRGYDAHGRLVSRGHPDALVRRPEEAASRMLGLLRSGTIMAVDGTPLTLRADTICFHSDSPGAARMAEAVRDALIAAGVSLAPMSLSASPGGDSRP